MFISDINLFVLYFSRYFLWCICIRRLNWS